MTSRLQGILSLVSQIRRDCLQTTGQVKLAIRKKEELIDFEDVRRWLVIGYVLDELMKEPDVNLNIGNIAEISEMAENRLSYYLSSSSLGNVSRLHLKDALLELARRRGLPLGPLATAATDCVSPAFS